MPPLTMPQSTPIAHHQRPAQTHAGPIARSPDRLPLIQSDILPSYQQQPYGAAPPQSTPSVIPFTPPQPPPTPATPLSHAALRSGSHLEPAQRAAMEQEMRNAEESLRLKIDEAKRSWAPDDLERRLTSLKNSHATKQSQIRKKYGIRLRTRRGPSAMMEERVRVGLPASLPPKKASTPNPNTTTTPNGTQQQPNENGKRPLDMEAVAPSPSHRPIKKLAVLELTGGLGGTSATAAMQDPTALMALSQPGAPSATPMNLSQSHFSTYARENSGSAGQRMQATPQRIQMGVAGRGFSREEPVGVDSSSDSGSDIEAE